MAPPSEHNCQKNMKGQRGIWTRVHGIVDWRAHQYTILQRCKQAASAAYKQLLSKQSTASTFVPDTARSPIYR